MMHIIYAGVSTVRQRVHRRRYPRRADGTRKRGTYVAGSKKPTALKRKPRVFVSFHSKDRHAKELLVAQAKNKNMDLQFSDQSPSKSFNSKWKRRMKPRIQRASTTMVMVGKDTHKRPAVKWEIEQSRKAGNKVVAVQIHKGKHHRLPSGIKKKEETGWNVNKLSKRIRKRG